VVIEVHAGLDNIGQRLVPLFVREDRRGSFRSFPRGILLWIAT
jgi:hypothetical protein